MNRRLVIKPVKKSVHVIVTGIRVEEGMEIVVEDLRYEVLFLNWLMFIPVNTLVWR